MAVTDYKFPGTATNVDYYSSYEWTHPDYVKADDTSYSASGADKNYGSDILLLTNFGFTSSDIPSGATIDGIEFVVSRYAAKTVIKDYFIYLQSSSGNVGSNMASATAWPTSIGEATYGGSANLCGWTAASQSAIVSSTFGVNISCFDPSYSESSKVAAYVDYIKIRVYYTEGGGATVKPHYYYLQQ